VDAPFVSAGVPLPDARLDLWGRRKRTEVVLGGSHVFERVFCVNCGIASGAVPRGCPVFYLCDECVGKWGPPPGCIEVKTDGL
jgi:hypothetical protein